MSDENENGVTASGDAKLNAKIKRQIEYYFGDHNLMRDKFLKEKIKEDDGWVSLETMLNFNRLKQLTEDHKVICLSLKESSLIEVNDASDKVRRKTDRPLPEDNKEWKDAVAARTVYAKEFPADSNLDDLMEFFENYGNIDNLQMRREFHKKSIFKGSVFVTFQNKDDADKFVNESETKYKEKILEAKLFKEDYFKKKMGDRKGKPQKENVTNDDGPDCDDKKDDESQSQTKISIEDRARKQMHPNAVFHFTGLNPETTVMEVKDFFNEFGDVGFADFEMGDTEGYIRMREANTAASTIEKAKEKGEGKIVIKDSEIETRIVEGEEELKYWVKMVQSVHARLQQKRNNRTQGFRGGRGGRGGRRGGRGGHQGKRRGNDDGGPAAKVAKSN